MKSEKLNGPARILLVVCSLLLVITLFVPMWRIDLDAPQYPEGLRLLIYPNKLGGNVDIVNGLNHYIGMKTLHTEDFVEFTILPYLLGFFGLLFLITAISGRRKMLVFSLTAFVIFGIVAMIDFWKWEYNYGHNLNPDAAIIVPGMSYQPPLIGFKQLLNFGAYSIPSTGGWLIIAAGGLLVTSLLISRKKVVAPVLNKGSILLLGFLAAPTLFCACQTGPVALKPGKDRCDYCQMTVMDLRFGAELVTKKGKVLRFDDAHCLKSYLAEQKNRRSATEDIYFADFSHEHGFIDSKKALFLHSDALKSPMNGNTAAFSDQVSLDEAKILFPGTVKTLNEIIQ
jgi:copper chaperone NosL